MHVAGPILHAEDVGGLRHVRQDRVVTRHLPVVRVEAAKRAFDLLPRRHHDTVHIDRQRAETERGQHPRDDARVEILQPADGGHREHLQPAADGPRRRQVSEPGEAAEQWIVGDIRHMPQSATADHQQAQQQPHHRHEAVVAPRRGTTKDLAHQRVEPRLAEIPREQFEPGVRGQRDVAEVQRQIAIDTRLQIEFPLSHCQRPFVVDVEGWVAPPFNHNGGPFSISKS